VTRRSFAFLAVDRFQVAGEIGSVSGASLVEYLRSEAVGTDGDHASAIAIDIIKPDVAVNVLQLERPRLTQR
jgi:hypothetical protein